MRSTRTAVDLQPTSSSMCAGGCEHRCPPQPGCAPSDAFTCQYQLLQAALMANPEAGSLIRGSGGLRKVRWAVDGKGVAASG